ncbi:pyrolysin [Ceratobasidium sp. AG-Ba]|nr:pyrolysin [Ceratobasidium sp. AG-Ba]
MSLETFGLGVEYTISALFDEHPAPSWAFLRRLSLACNAAIASLSLGDIRLDYFRGLLELNLENVEWDLTGTDFLKTLTECPEMHTLRLHRLMESHDTSPDPTISMKSLRLLDMDNTGAAVLSYLNAPLELDLRLSSWSHKEHTRLSILKAFCARSRVVALTLRSQSNGPSGDQITVGQLAKGLRFLRTMRFEGISLEQDAPCQLAGLSDCYVALRLPNLRSICFAKYFIILETTSELDDLLNEIKLVRLAFLDCRFARPSIGRRRRDEPRWEEEGVLETMLPVFYAISEKVIIRDEVPVPVCHGVDPFVREMMEAD